MSWEAAVTYISVLLNVYISVLQAIMELAKASKKEGSLWR